MIAALNSRMYLMIDSYHCTILLIVAAIDVGVAGAAVSSGRVAWSIVAGLSKSAASGSAYASGTALMMDIISIIFERVQPYLVGVIRSRDRMVI